MTGTHASVLVVDDTPENLDLLMRRVQQLGHAVSVAENGRAAMEFLAGNAVDLVLLDIMMPEMDGYEVLSRMQTDPKLAKIPVIVISALNEIDGIVRCIELGAEDYLFKPFNTILLKARIGATLEKKRLRDLEARQAAALLAEQQRSEKLLLSIFPKPVADRLRENPAATIADHFDDCSILFADISGFARLSDSLAPTAVVGVLNMIFSAFDRLTEQCGCDKIKTISDAYIAAAGVPRQRADHAEAVADLALAMQLEAIRMKTGLDEPLSLRIGIDSGPVVAGVIGSTRFAYDLWGPTVSRASYMESSGLPGGIHVTAATYEKLKANYVLEERGAFYIPGQGDVTTYLLKGKRPASLRRK